MTDFHVEILKTQRGTLDAKEVESRINSFLGTMMINLTKVIFLEGTKSAMIIMTHMVHHAKSKVIGNNKTWGQCMFECACTKTNTIFEQEIYAVYPMVFINTI